MADPALLRNLAWFGTTLLELVLLVLLVRQKVYRSHPAFCLYINVAILQSVVMFFAYRHWGSENIVSFNVGWGGQSVVICARWLAVAEIARAVLANYSGVRRLASGLLFVMGICVLAYSLVISQTNVPTALLNADRGVELSISAFLVALLFFARYYRLPIAPLERYLAIGFCLYSCFYVINDSIYDIWRASVGVLWSFLDVLTFFATFLLWISAVAKRPEAEVLTVRPPVSSETYARLSQEANTRLHLLNRHLDHLLHAGGSRS